MKVVFMGTPDFAVESLKALCEAGVEVTLVVTQPDREKGRGREVQMTPVKEYAISQNIPVFQPQKIKEEEAVAELRKYEADFFVVAAFGQILSQEILDMPKYGCVNVHASLLPRYRGAAPIQWAILNGDEVAGVTIMQMELGLDSGPMLSKVEVPIAENETGDSLFEKLSKAGAKLLVETLPKLMNGEITPEEQDESKATHVKMLKKEMGRVDWNKEAIVVERLVRGLNSWPGAFCTFRNKTLKIWGAKAISDAELDQMDIPYLAEVEPGEVSLVTKDAIYIKTGEGYLRLDEVQMESKKRMSTHDFLLGYQVVAGERFKA